MLRCEPHSVVNLLGKSISAQTAPQSLAQFVKRSYLEYNLYSRKEVNGIVVVIWKCCEKFESEICAGSQE
jgi:hypothetical protein